MDSPFVPILLVMILIITMASLFFVQPVVQGEIVETNVTETVASNYYLDVASGKVEGHKLVHKFGATTLDSDIHPMTFSTHYRTPLTAVSLEVLSNDADDNGAGNGARKVVIVGLNSSWDEVSQEVTLTGTTPVVLPIPLTRVYRWYVSESGTYADETTGSHEGDLTIRQAGGGAVWSIIYNDPFPIGQSLIGAYSVPRGYDAYLLKKVIFVDSSKSADIYFFKREYINDTTSPYSGTMRLVEREVGITGGYDLTLASPNFLCSSPCDLGFMGLISSGTAEASIEFELLLVEQ